MLRILLADDERLAIDRLRLLLEGEEGVQIVGEAVDGRDAADKIAALKPNLILLDINMPVQDGVSLARSLDADCGSEVVFITAYDEFAVQAYDIDAVDYILKPVSAERLRIALARARRRLGNAHSEPPLVAGEEPAADSSNYVSSLWVQKRQGLAKIDVTLIEWIEAARDYVLLHTQTRTYIMRATMDTLSRKLDPQVMVRVSRSAFVRRDAVQGIERQGRNGLILVLADAVAVRAGTTFIRKIEDQFGVKALQAPPS